MDWRVSPAGTSPCPPCSVFLPCLWGWEMVLSPHVYPCPDTPLPPLSHRRQRKGRGWGGQGSPSVLRLHRVFRLNQEIFYYQKEKRKKKIPAATFPPCPIGTVETGSVGFPGRVAQGWNTLRQEWWSSLSGPPPGPLWASPLFLPSFPSKQTTRGGLPLTSGPWAGAWGAGAGAGVLHSPEVGGWAGSEARGSGLPPRCPLPPFPRAGHFLPQAAVGTFVPLLKSLCHLLPPPPR